MTKEKLQKALVEAIDSLNKLAESLPKGGHRNSIEATVVGFAVLNLTLEGDMGKTLIDILISKKVASARAAVEKEAAGE